MAHEAQIKKSLIDILTMHENQWTYRGDIKTESSYEVVNQIVPRRQADRSGRDERTKAGTIKPGSNQGL